MVVNPVSVCRFPLHAFLYYNVKFQGAELTQSFGLCSWKVVATVQSVIAVTFQSLLECVLVTSAAFALAKYVF